MLPVFERIQTVTITSNDAYKAGIRVAESDDYASKVSLQAELLTRISFESI